MRSDIDHSTRLYQDNFAPYPGILCNVENLQWTLGQ
jgi:hypothetical protein